MKSIFPFTLIVLSTVSLSCTKSTVEEQTTGTIIHNAKGSVVVMDRNNRAVQDASGVVVTVENSNPEITLPVDGQANFDLSKLTHTGKTVLLFSKPGYPTVKKYYTQSSLDSIKAAIANEPIYLYPKSDVVIKAISGKVDGNILRINLDASSFDASTTNGATIFLQKNDPNVSFVNSRPVSKENVFPYYFTVAVKGGNNTHEICLQCSKDCGSIRSGDVIYLKAYGDVFAAPPYSGANRFFNPLNNTVSFPFLNAEGYSQTLSFVVP